MATSNKDLLNSIRSNASEEYRKNIPLATNENIKEIYSLLSEYPTSKNEFMNVFINKIGKTQFFNKLFENPLRVLKKGSLDFGKSIEQIFVEAGEGIDFSKGGHYEGQTSIEGDLIGKNTPKISIDYITENYQKQYKFTFSEIQLKGAFYNQEGLSNLLSRELTAQLTKANYDEYEAMKNLLNSTKITKTHELSINYTPRDLAYAGRLLRRKFTYLSSDYNESGVKNNTEENKFVIFITPEVEATLDVDFYSKAFNLSNAELLGRIIVVDKFEDTEGETTHMIVADEDYLQVWDTLNTSGTFINEQQLYTNNFLNRWAVMGICKFCNAVRIITKE